MQHLRCRCARERACAPTRTEPGRLSVSLLEFSLKLCCDWNWLSQARSLPWRSRAGDRGRRALRRGPRFWVPSGFHLGECWFRSLGPGLGSLPCPFTRPSVRPPVEQGARRAAASLCAVKVGVDARQPRRSCQALSLLAFPSLRPSLRGALLSRSSALRLFTLPGSAAAPGVPAAPTGRGRATGRAVLPSPTGTGPARWQKAGGRGGRVGAAATSEMSCPGLKRQLGHAWAPPPRGQALPARLSPGAGGVTSQSRRVLPPEEGPRAGPGGPDPAGGCAGGRAGAGRAPRCC